MATSITQAKSLLTAAELELFDQSRAEPIKALSAKQLASKEKRTRTLRDKYRDLYRRQTVAQRGKAAGKKASGSAYEREGTEANARTERKAEIMEEMLARFEARSVLLETRSERESGGAVPSKQSKSAAVPAGNRTAASAQKTASGVKPAAKPLSAKVPSKTASLAKKPSNGTASEVEAKPVKGQAAGVSKTAAKPTAVGKAGSTATTATTAKTAKTAKTAIRKIASASKTPRTPRTPQTLSAIANLHEGSDRASPVDHLTGHDPVERSHKAPSDLAPTYGDKAHAPALHAPLDTVPAAERGNQVKRGSGNIAIQGHISSSVRHAQGKRDSR